MPRCASRGHPALGGLWQRVRRHPPRVNLSTAMLALRLLELLVSSVLFFLLPLALLVPLPLPLLVLAVPELIGGAAGWPGSGEMYGQVAAHLTLTAVLSAVFFPGYLLTCVVAALERQPRLLLVGAFFPFMRMLDAAISLSAVPVAWFSVSSGRWTSPARRAPGGGPAQLPGTGTRAGPDHPARVAEASYVSG